MPLLMVFLTALFVTMVTVPLFMRLSARLRFVDIPDHRKIHTTVIPRVGGIGIVLGAAVATGLWTTGDDGLHAFSAAVAILTCFGLADDRFDLDYRLKLVGQLLAIAVMVSQGGVLIHRLDLFGIDRMPESLAYLLTTFFLLGTTNAMNLSDGLDGLAAGLSALSLCCMAYLAREGGGGASDLLLVVCGIVGAILGFLRYNTHPAVVFMGDTGSQFLGFAAGVFSIKLTQEVNPVLSSALPLLLMGLPVLDTLRVMGDRLVRRVSPFKPDLSHFHHRLLALGFDHYETVLVGYGLQAGFILLALHLRYASDGLILGLYLSLLGILSILLTLAERRQWRIHGLAVADLAPLERGLKYLDQKRWVEALVSAGVGGGLILLSLWVSYATQEVGSDIAALAAAVGLVWLVVAIAARGRRTVTDRLALYICVLLVGYLIARNGPRQPWLEQAATRLATVEALLVGVGARLSRRYFSVTPSDFLVLFLLVVAASVPGAYALNFARLAVEAAIGFSAVEYLLRRRERPSTLLRAGGMLALTVIAWRGW